jgi:hypothetical protein
LSGGRLKAKDIDLVRAILSSTNLPRYLRRDPICVRSDVTFPTTNHHPAQADQLIFLLTVTFDIPQDLRCPVWSVVSVRQPLKPIVEIASVPEIAVTKNDNVRVGEYEIWFSWEVVHVRGGMKLESSQGVEKRLFAPRPLLSTASRRGGTVRSAS